MLINDIKDAHDKAIFSSRSINQAEKKVKSKGKKYTKKDLKRIMENINFAVQPHKTNGYYMDSYFETIGDDDNHIILALHTGAMLNRMLDFEFTFRNYQFTLWDIIKKFPTIAEVLEIGYYPVNKIANLIKQTHKLDIDRIKKYIKNEILLIDNDGKLIYNPNSKARNISKKTIMKAEQYYKVLDNKLNFFFVSPKYYNKYIGFIFTPKMNIDEVKYYMVSNEKKGYTNKNNKGFLVSFALKIANRSYSLTVNNQPLIQVDSYFNQFPEIRDLINSEVNIVEKELNISFFKEKGISEFFRVGDTVIPSGNKIRLYTPFMMDVLMLTTNFIADVSPGGGLKIFPRELLAFLYSVTNIDTYIPEKYVVTAVDYGSLTGKLGKMLKSYKNKASLLPKIATISPEIKKIIYLFNKIYTKLDMYNKFLEGSYKKIKSLYKKFNNKKYYNLLLVETLMPYIKASILQNNDIFLSLIKDKDFLIEILHNDILVTMKTGKGYKEILQDPENLNLDFSRLILREYLTKEDKDKLLNMLEKDNKIVLDILLLIKFKHQLLELIRDDYGIIVALFAVLFEK